MVFVFQKVFTNTIFYKILVFGDTNISIKIIFGLFLGIYFSRYAAPKSALASLPCDRRSTLLLRIQTIQKDCVIYS